MKPAAYLLSTEFGTRSCAFAGKHSCRAGPRIFNATLVRILTFDLAVPNSKSRVTPFLHAAFQYKKLSGLPRSSCPERAACASGLAQPVIGNRLIVRHTNNEGETCGKPQQRKEPPNRDRNHPNSRKRPVPAQKSRTGHKPVPVEKPVSGSSSRTHTRRSDVPRDVVHTPIDVQEVLGALAGIAGGVLGVMAAVVAAPIAVAVTGVGAVGLGVAGALGGVGRKYYRTAEEGVVEISRGVIRLAKSASSALEDTSVKTVEFDTDLKRREYRDERGQLHHHTHTYMRDHSDE